MKTQKIKLSELKEIVKKVIKEENQHRSVPRIDKNDFMNNRVIEIGDLKIVLSHLQNPDYYIARYYDIDNELEGSYGSPNYRDVIYDISHEISTLQ